MMEDVFKFMDKKRKNEIDNLSEIKTNVFMSWFDELLKSGRTFSLEVCGLDRNLVMYAVTYLMVEFDKITLPEKKNNYKIYAVESYIANKTAITFNESIFDSYGRTTEKDRTYEHKMQCVLELISVSDVESIWIVYDKWYNKLYQVTIPIDKEIEELSKDVFKKLLLACLPKNFT